MRLLTRQALGDIAAGAIVLGAGGGGDPYIDLDYTPLEVAHA